LLVLQVFHRLIGGGGGLLCLIRCSRCGVAVLLQIFVEFFGPLVELLLEIFDLQFGNRAFLGDHRLVVVKLVLHLWAGRVIDICRFGDFGELGFGGLDRRLRRGRLLAQGCDIVL